MTSGPWTGERRSRERAPRKVAQEIRDREVERLRKNDPRAAKTKDFIEWGGVMAAATVAAIVGPNYIESEVVAVIPFVVAAGGFFAAAFGVPSPRQWPRLWRNYQREKSKE